MGSGGTVSLNDPQGTVPILLCVCETHANSDGCHEGLCMAKSDVDQAACKCGNACMLICSVSLWSSERE